MKICHSSNADFHYYRIRHSGKLLHLLFLFPRLPSTWFPRFLRSLRFAVEGVTLSHPDSSRTSYIRHHTDPCLEITQWRQTSPLPRLLDAVSLPFVSCLSCLWVWDAVCLSFVSLPLLFLFMGHSLFVLGLSPPLVFRFGMQLLCPLSLFFPGSVCEMQFLSPSSLSYSFCVLPLRLYM